MWNNTFKPMLVPVGVPLGIVIVAGVILPLVSDIGLSLVLGIAALSITLLNSAQIALSKANPVKADAIVLLVGDDYLVGVEVFNPDTAAVAIKSVTLIDVTGSDKKSEELAEEGKARELEKNIVEEHFPEGVSRFTIGGKSIARFHLDRFSEQNWDHLRGLPHKSFWLEIECFGGAVMTIPGIKILAAIQKRFSESV
jgi:hypothetical protein